MKICIASTKKGKMLKRNNTLFFCVCKKNADLFLIGPNSFFTVFLLTNSLIQNEQILSSHRMFAERQRKNT